MRTITVIGSVNMDLVVTCDRIPRVGETVLGDDFTVTPGGKGANQAVAAARLGAEVRFVGCVGNDEYGHVARENLASFGVDVSDLRTVDDHTGVALIMVDKYGRNLITVAPGANLQAAPTGTCDIALLQLEVPFAKPQAETLILNAAPADTIPLDGVDVLIVNRLEAEQLSGRREPEQARPALLEQGAGEVIVTLGDQGVYDGAMHPAFPIKAVDTVGAGDAFVGAYAAALAAGRTDPVGLAQAAAALTCTRPGAQTVPSIDEVERLMR
jgi:ribokinase